MLRRIRRRTADESGVALVLVAIMMVSFLGLAALAIDIGSYYQAQRQAQSAADAGALAASQNLPSNTTSAMSVGTTYATTNYPGSTVTVSTPYGGVSTKVKVTVNASTPSFFGRIFGITSQHVTASAVAQETPGVSSCSTPGSACYAIFAMDTSCTSPPVVFGGGTHVTGGVWTNGSLNVGGGGSSFGPTYYGNGSGCSVSPSGYQSQSNTFTSGPTASAPVTTWPIDYSTDFPACSGAACTGPGGTPSFCTQSSTTSPWTLDSYYPYTLTSNNIYCAVGSGTASTPSTWNGVLDLNQSGSPAIVASYVAGTVNIGGGSSLTACGYAVSGYSSSNCGSSVPAPSTTNYPLIWATGTGTCINNSGGGGTFHGDMFGPNCTIYMGGGTNSVTFFEAQDVQVPGGGFTGDGPSSSGVIQSGSGSTSLIQ